MRFAKPDFWHSLPREYRDIAPAVWHRAGERCNKQEQRSCGGVDSETHRHYRHARIWADCRQVKPAVENPHS